MLDSLLRPLKEQVLGPAARTLGHRVVPMTVTLAAFALGLAAAGAASRAAYGVGLFCWWASRVLDGFDGTLARTQGTQSAIGGYVDLLLDFVVYAAIPFGLVVGAPSVPLAIAALAMVGSFYVNAASWMYLSALLERRGEGAGARGELTSITMPDGLVGGTETIVLFTLYFVWPERLPALFWLSTGLVGVTVAQRLVWAIRHLRG